MDTAVAVLVALGIVVAVLGGFGVLVWFFGDRQPDVHPFHLPPYRRRR